jgi:hypothetical protein
MTDQPPTELPRAPAKKTPRAPVLYSDELALEICRRIAEGEALKALCREPGFPHYTTFFGWLAEHEVLARHYEAAAKMRGQHHADLILELANETPHLTTDKFGAVRVDQGWVLMQRLKIDTHKWLASKYYPKMYGERVAISGELGLKHSVNELTDDELAAIAAGGRAASAEPPPSTH